MHLSLILLAGAGAVVAQSMNDPNAPCGMQPYGYGPPSFPSTDSGFSQNPVYQYASLVAPAPTNYAMSFRNATGSTQQSGYMGLYVLETYNTTQCAQFCSNANGCQAFNIYFERDPILNPASQCPNPPPTTNIKCTLYNTPVSLGTATNQGGYREQFHVVIAGSDGFNQF